MIDLEMYTKLDFL